MPCEGMQDVLSGRRVLIIEDEPVVAMLLEEMLDDLGATVAGRARSLDRALQADATRCDAAVVDINLQGRKSYVAAERLACAGVPIVFVTGYTRERPPGTLSAAPMLLKPYGIHELAEALRRALGARAAA